MNFLKFLLLYELYLFDKLVRIKFTTFLNCYLLLLCHYHLMELLINCLFQLETTAIFEFEIRKLQFDYLDVKGPNTFFI